MSITKTFLKSRPACKVKFKLSPEDVGFAEELYLVGDFNDWNNSSHPMKKSKGGAFSIEIELPLGQDCQFRYRTSDNAWFNDADADGYVPCTYACVENSLVKA